MGANICPDKVFKRCHAVMEEWSLGIGPILTVFSWLVAVTDTETRTMSHVAQQWPVVTDIHSSPVTC